MLYYVILLKKFALSANFFKKITFPHNGRYIAASFAYPLIEFDCSFMWRYGLKNGSGYRTV